MATDGTGIDTSGGSCAGGDDSQRISSPSVMTFDNTAQNLQALTTGAAIGMAYMNGQRLLRETATRVPSASAPAQHDKEMQRRVRSSWDNPTGEKLTPSQREDHVPGDKLPGDGMSPMKKKVIGWSIAAATAIGGGGIGVTKYRSHAENQRLNAAQRIEQTDVVPRTNEGEPLVPIINRPVTPGR